MSPSWTIQTGRLVLSPVGWADLPDLQALKADPGVYAQMLGGVRLPGQVAAELAMDVSFWAARGVGMWMVRDGAGVAVGLTGLHERTDGLGIALRFAFRPAARGHGLAREAAGAALRFAQGQASIQRVVAVANDQNLASRTVLGAIGMRQVSSFERGGSRFLVFESVSPPLADAWR